MNTTRFTFIIFALFAHFLFSFANAQNNSTPISVTPQADSYSTNVIVSGLNHPWAHEFLPNGDILVTERSGAIKVIRNGKLLEVNVGNVPKVYFAGQGGLLDIMLDTEFELNNTVYLSYAIGDRKSNAIRLISARLARLASHDDSYKLTDIKILFTASPFKSGPQHYSGRIVQLADTSLLLTTGDGFDYREQAQKLDNHFGKIIRINTDGSVPTNNPFVNHASAKPEIWSYGHRNQQGLVVANGIVYQHEHGPAGGDEVNIIKPGLNYGWPAITYGKDYNGAQITPFKQYPNMQQPKIDWTPSVAPSSMVYHDNTLYVTSMVGPAIRSIAINGNELIDQGQIFSDISGRVRDISVGPDSAFYILTDGQASQLIKIK